MRVRSIRHRGKRRKKENQELDITSLLDILVILLIFLIKNYDATGVIINIPDGIVLPHSKSQSKSQQGITIQVSSQKIWVDNKEIVNMEEKPLKKHLDHKNHEGRLIIPLFNELVQKKDTIDKIKNLSEQAKSFSGISNLIITKTTRYSTIRKIMYTCAEAGFQKYKFIVKGSDDF